jgi:hypothetical protein
MPFVLFARSVLNRSDAFANKASSVYLHYRVKRQRSHQEPRVPEEVVQATWIELPGMLKHPSDPRRDLGGYRPTNCLTRGSTGVSFTP